MNQSQTTTRNRILNRVSIITLVVLFSIIPAVFLFGLIRMYIFELNPKTQHANWISEDGSIYLSDSKGKIQTESGTYDYIMYWGEGAWGDSDMILMADDVYKYDSSFYKSHLYAVWDFVSIRKNSFKVKIIESDFLKEGTTYKFNKTDMDLNSELFPIVTTDTPVSTGTAIYHCGEFDSNITWESAFSSLRDEGYTVEQWYTFNRFKVYKKSNDDFQYASVLLYDSKEETLQAQQEILSYNIITKGAILCINNAVVQASTDMAKEIASLFGIESLREFAVVDTITILETDYTLSSDFAARLQNEGYRQAAPGQFSYQRNSSLPYAYISPNADYSFNLLSVGNTEEEIREYLMMETCPITDGIVYAKCYDNSGEEKSTYLLAAPLEEIHSILDLICEK